MQISLTLSTARYRTPSISLSTNVTSTEAKVSIPFVRDKIRTRRRIKEAGKQRKDSAVDYDDLTELHSAAATPTIERALKFIVPSHIRKKEEVRRKNTLKLIQLLSIYPIAFTIASYLNKAELKALFSPKCCVQIYLMFRHPRIPEDLPPHSNINRFTVLREDPPKYYGILSKQTRECEKCGDTAHRFIPMLLDLGLTYELYTVLQGITKCYLCKRSYCHACLVRFFVEGDTYRRNTMRKPRHACDSCLPKAQSLFGNRIGRLQRGPSQAEYEHWKATRESKPDRFQQANSLSDIYTLLD